MLSPPKPRKPPFTIESAMSSIFKKKKHNKNEIEDVVIEKVIASNVTEPHTEQPPQQQEQIVNSVDPNSDKKADTKTEQKKGLKTRFMFSLSRTKRDEINLPDNKMSDKDLNKSVEHAMSKRDSISSENNCIIQSNHVTTNGSSEKGPTNTTDNDILCAKPILNKKRWSRRTKSSPPPPPPQTKTNGISNKPMAPLPPIPIAPETNLSSSPEPPPLAPKGLKHVSSSMTSLRSQVQQANGITPNGRASQPVTPAAEKRSDNHSLVTRLRQGDESHNTEGQMLLRSGLEAGTDDITDLRCEDEAGMQEDKSKRKNAQVCISIKTKLLIRDVTHVHPAIPLKMVIFCTPFKNVNRKNVLPVSSFDDC
jgi:hypothetical protein